MPFASKSKEYVKAYNKGRYQGKFRQHQLEKIDCECGKKVCRASMSNHKKSRVHIMEIKNIEHKKALKELEEQLRKMNNPPAGAKSS